MRVAVLSSPTSWYLKDLTRAGEKRHEITSLTFSALSSVLQNGQATVTSEGVDLGRFDRILVRTMPPGSLEQVVFRMDVLARLEANGIAVINSPRAIEIAVDKYLASCRLQDAELLTPTTIACQSVEEAMDAFQALGGHAVLKPLFGAEGRGIMLLDDEGLALRAFKVLSQLNAVIYLQEFIPHEGFDMRLLVVGDRVWGMRRRNDSDWRTNISRGAIPEPLELNSQLTEIAHRAAAAVGATLAGVDLLPARDGRLFTIEVNAVPGWKAMARTLNIDIASHVLECLKSEGIGRDEKG